MKAGKLKVGICGAGSFANCFIPLFQAHPGVAEVCLAEVLPERRAAQAQKFGGLRTFASLDALCASDVDAVAIFTQRSLHGPHVIQALRAGKHVYCAVPTAETLEQIAEIIALVRSTGLTYMLGETSYYYPSHIFCRDKFRKGEFGNFVYGEGEYYHDMSHGFYKAYQHSGGADWKKFAGFPPMLYPTHSVSMVLGVTGARMSRVSCLGYVDRHEDGIFREGANLWDNVFSNQSAFFRTSDGGMARINEFRRVGIAGKNSVRLSLYGTMGSYEEQANAQVWTNLAREMTDVRSLLDCQADAGPAEIERRLREGEQLDFHSRLAKVHPVARLPVEFKNQPNGHHGSHQFLVDDFLRACLTGKLPPNHVWAAARYCAPGIVAHESAKREGELLEIPDFGNPSPGAAFLEDELPLIGN